MNDTITAFQGEHRFLSNFWKCKIDYMGYVWPSAEHAYQAMKSDDPGVWEEVLASDSVGDAKRYGRTIDIRYDWDQAKFYKMYDIVYAKFTQNEDLARKLLDTGNQKIEEGNRRGDTYWGISPEGSGIGENNLGKILMSVRNLLKKKQENNQ